MQSNKLRSEADRFLEEQQEENQTAMRGKCSSPRNMKMVTELRRAAFS
ncbi:hypothetical protein V5J35_003188 [Endozoicomonas sp. NE40]|uniref:Uncharacterized protein n=1 Tax=Endozoicomonas lisbonensis TaxID=3120522 RepID=A0ABV2SL67_9GAMM